MKKNIITSSADSLVNVSQDNAFSTRTINYEDKELSTVRFAKTCVGSKVYKTKLSMKY